MALKNKFISALTVAVAMFAFSTFASAQNTAPTEPTDKQTKREWRKGKGDVLGKGFKRGKRGGMMRGLRGIELTDAQKEQIRSIREANRPSDELRQEMRTLMTAKRDGTITPEQQTRLEAIKQEGKTKGRLVKEQVKAVLTPEQIQQIETKKAEMRERFEQRRQMREQNRPKTETEKKDN